MAHDTQYFRRRALEARAASFNKDESEGVDVAGQLALAYAALARRKGAVETVSETEEHAGESPLLLRS